MEKTIAGIVAGICGVEPEELEPGLNLFDEGLLDSFGVIQLVLALEEAFSVSLEIENIPRERIATVSNIVGLIREVAS